jgi:putative sigma-54 modulation protein
LSPPGRNIIIQNGLSFLRLSFFSLGALSPSFILLLLRPVRHFGRSYMKLVIQGKNIEITDAIRDHVHQKIQKAVAHHEQLDPEIDVNLSVANNPRITDQQTAEVTIYANGTIIRAEESSENLYASIDMVADKVSRRMRKYKEKRQVKKGNTSVKDVPLEVLSQVDSISPDVLDERIQNGQPELPPQIVRTKYFPMPPMSVDEAVERLQLVGHDFYMFRNEETGEINVAYKRNHGGFGVLLPKENSLNGNGSNGRHQVSQFSNNGHNHNSYVPASRPA